MSETFGGCVCGAVRYRLAEEPIAFYVCHCTDCQRRTGSAFGLSMVIRREAVQVLQGELEYFHFSMPDGRQKAGRYCCNCVTHLWWEPVKYPQLLVLRPGTLDDADAYEPFGDVWTSSAQPWVSFTKGPKFEHQPQDRLAVVRAWQERGRS